MFSRRMLNVCTAGDWPSQALKFRLGVRGQVARIIEVGCCVFSLLDLQRQHVNIKYYVYFLYVKLVQEMPDRLRLERRLHFSQRMFRN